MSFLKTRVLKTTRLDRNPKQTQGTQTMAANAPTVPWECVVAHSFEQFKKHIDAFPTFPNSNSWPVAGRELVRMRLLCKV